MVEQSAWPDGRPTISDQLMILSRDRGLWRSGLYEFFLAELPDLAQFWGIDQLAADGVEETALDDTIREEVIERLDEHVEMVALRTQEPKNEKALREARQRFRHNILLAFNATPRENSDVLEKRRQRGGPKSSASTIFRNKKHFFKKIENQVLNSGYWPTMPVSDPYVRSDSSPAAPKPAGLEPSLERPGQPPRKKSRRRVVAMTAVSVVAATAAAVPIVLTRTGSQSPTESYITVQNSPVAFKTGQTTNPSFVVPLPISQIERPPPYEGMTLAPLKAWTVKYGAVYADTMHIFFTARGTVSEQTLITDARLEVVRREAPLTGTWVRPSGGDQGPDRQLYADLDQDPVKLTTDGTWQYPLRVQNTDQESFTVTVRTKHCHCYWRILLTLLLPNNKAEIVVVDDEGKPFETTSSTSATDKTYYPTSPSQSWPMTSPGG